MKLTFVRVADPGDRDKERIHLRVANPTNLANFVILRSTALATEDKVAAGQLVAYWFSQHDARAGDSVVVYTKPGDITHEPQKDGTTNHFCFWGLTEPIFKAENDVVVLCEISDWITWARSGQKTPTENIAAATSDAQASLA